MKEVLFVGFKGKNNTSQQLVSLLPTTHKKMLTNSFSGLYKDIERIQTEKYAGVVLFGIDKVLKDCVRIEQTAAYNGEWKHSIYPIAELAEDLAMANIKYEVSSVPTKYLCNAAYFYMLNKCSNSVFLHIPSLRGMTPVLMQQLQDVFSCPCFCPYGNS